MDADVKAHPAALACAVASAREGRIDLLSLLPKQELHSFAERLILPCGLYVLGFSQNVSKTQSPHSNDATATGQFMLFRREAYEAIGGHAAVQECICEDVELARLMKRKGYRVLLQDGTKVLTTRMYTGWKTLWPGIAKNLCDMLGGPVRTTAIGGTAVAMAWGAVLLPVFAWTGCTDGSQAACIAAVPATLGAAAALGLHIAGALHFGIPAWYGLLFPLGYSIGALIALDSVRCKLARRVRWKGRVYP
jgi:chlorobactene glucosyltransferase